MNIVVMGWPSDRTQDDRRTNVQQGETSFQTEVPDAYLDGVWACGAGPEWQSPASVRSTDIRHVIDQRPSASWLLLSPWGRVRM